MISFHHYLTALRKKLKLIQIWKIGGDNEAVIIERADNRHYKAANGDLFNRLKQLFLEKFVIVEIFP